MPSLGWPKSSKGATDPRGGHEGMHIYIDGDACPVKDEVYRVAGRNGVKVSLVSNAPIRVPPGRT